jgi:hypothetical protein
MEAQFEIICREPYGESDDHGRVRCAYMALHCNTGVQGDRSAPKGLEQRAASVPVDGEYARCSYDVKLRSEGDPVTIPERQRAGKAR